VVQQSGVRSMKNNKYLLSVLLILTIAVSLVVLVLVRTFLPIVILPKFSLANISLVSLVALVINYYITGNDNDYISIAVAFLAFLLLPFVAGFVTFVEALLLAVKGVITFTAQKFIFGSILNRLEANGKNIFAPVITAFLLFLAVQCFMGIF
jgi:hypothetical protein